LRTEIEGWIGGASAGASPYVHLRAMGFVSKQQAERWAKINDVPFLSKGGKLLARRADAAAAEGAPASVRVFYTTSATPGEHDTRDAAAEALRSAIGWNTIALSHDVDRPEVTAFQTEAESVRMDSDLDPTAPRIFRRAAIVRATKQ
jgi:hypothetical protein